jgi:hypothetical protein
LTVGALSLALRAAWAAHAHVIPVSDFATYDALGWQLVTNGELPASAYRTPGYPAFLAAVYAVFGHICARPARTAW